MENSNNEEVKDFTQTVNVVPSKDTELVDEEETETPPSSSDGEKEPEVEEADEVEPSDEDSTKDTEPTPTVEEPKQEPKPVEGETPRERALRLEMARVKSLLRKERTEELFVKQPDNPKIEEELAEYDPEEVKKFEKLVSKLGYAKKDDILSQTTQERLNDTFNEFMEAHSEYAPENDKDGILWNQFKAEFAIYNPTKDPKVLKKVLNKVHNDVFGVQPAKNLNKITASQEKIKVASHKGGSAGKETKTKTQAPSGLRLDGLKGFSEEELEELTS